jgi:PDZ domain
MTNSFARIAVAVLAGGLGTAAVAQQDEAPSQARVEQNRRADEEARSTDEEARRAVQEAERGRLEESRRAIEASRQEIAQREQELEQARRALMESREELERAARDVARLSADNARRQTGATRAFMYAALGRPMLGVQVDDADGGARVTSVSPGGPAQAAGVRTGDVIVSADGQALAGGDGSPRDRLISLVGEVEPGATVHLVVSRDGVEQLIDVQTRENGNVLRFFGDEPYSVRVGPGTVRVPGVSVGATGTPGAEWLHIFTPFASPWNDMELVPLTEQLGRYFGASEGLLVVRAPGDDTIGLQDGDVILTIGGRTPSSPEHAMRILASFEPGETVEISILREQRRRSIEYEIPGRDANED